MPTKERYERNKAYYMTYAKSDRRKEVAHKYDTSEKGRARSRATRQKRLDEGRCPVCGKDMLDGANNGYQCAVCLDDNNLRTKLRREFF